MGQPIVVLNSASIAADLLERRANIYSDRPTMIVTHEYLCGGLLFFTARYGEMYVSDSVFHDAELHHSQTVGGDECVRRHMKP